VQIIICADIVCELLFLSALQNRAKIQIFLDYNSNSFPCKGMPGMSLLFMVQCCLEAIQFFSVMPYTTFDDI